MSSRPNSRRAPAAATLLGALVLPLALGVWGGACTQDFPPFNQLDSLRVLAIQSEPPAPMTGETSTITPLVYTPTTMPDPSLTYTWSWCPLPGPAEMGHKCLIEEDQLTEILKEAFPDETIPFPPFFLGKEPTAMLENQLPAKVLGAVCMGIVPGVPRPNCSTGFPVQVALTVETDTEKKVEAVVTVKWRFDPMQAPNANPIIEGLTATLGDSEIGIPPADMLADDTVTLPRKTATRVDALVAPEASEGFDGIDETGMPASQEERLFITWFVESGGTDDMRTTYIPSRTPFEAMLQNTWSPQESRLYARGDARIYVVLHDNRGGVGWRTGIVHLEPTP